MTLSAWLTDPTAWGTIVAATALVLTQLPPLRVLFQRAHLKLSFPDRFTLTHYLGNTQLLVLVTVENVCARKVTVTKLDGLLLSPAGSAVALPGQTYISRQTPTATGQNAPELLLVGISLKPDEAWSETVRFFAPLSEVEEDQSNSIIGGIRKDLWKKQVTRMNAGSPYSIEADHDLVKEATDFFKQKFSLTKGNYTFIIAARDEKGRMLAVQGAEFTVYENSIATLREVTEEYKYGAGVYFSNNYSGYVQSRPRLIPPNEARELFQKKYPE